MIIRSLALAALLLVIAGQPVGASAQEADASATLQSFKATLEMARIPVLSTSTPGAGPALTFSVGNSMCQSSVTISRPSFRDDGRDYPAENTTVALDWRTAQVDVDGATTLIKDDAGSGLKVDLRDSLLNFRLLVAADSLVDLCGTNSGPPSGYYQHLPWPSLARATSDVRKAIEGCRSHMPDTDDWIQYSDAARARGEQFAVPTDSGLANGLHAASFQSCLERYVEPLGDRDKASLKTEIEAAYPMTMLSWAAAKAEYERDPRAARQRATAGRQ